MQNDKDVDRCQLFQCNETLKKYNKWCVLHRHNKEKLHLYIKTRDRQNKTKQRGLNSTAGCSGKARELKAYQRDCANNLMSFQKLH